jgi:hypothetical protein
MGAALPLQAPPDAAARCGSSHRQGPDVRKHAEGESVALHSVVRIEGARGSNPLITTSFRMSGRIFAGKFGLYSPISGSGGSRS